MKVYIRITHDTEGKRVEEFAETITTTATQNIKSRLDRRLRNYRKQFPEAYDIEISTVPFTFAMLSFRRKESEL